MLEQVPSAVNIILTRGIRSEIWKKWAAENQKDENDMDFIDENRFSLNIPGYKKLYFDMRDIQTEQDMFSMNSGFKFSFQDFERLIFYSGGSRNKHGKVSGGKASFVLFTQLLGLKDIGQGSVYDEDVMEREDFGYAYWSSTPIYGTNDAYMLLISLNEPEDSYVVTIEEESMDQKCGIIKA